MIPFCPNACNQKPFDAQLLGWKRSSLESGLWVHSDPWMWTCSSHVVPLPQGDQSPHCPLKEECFPLPYSCVHAGPLTKNSFSAPLMVSPNATDLSQSSSSLNCETACPMLQFTCVGVYVLHGKSVDFATGSPKIQLRLHYLLVEWSWEIYLTFEKFSPWNFFSQRCCENYKII